MYAKNFATVIREFPVTDRNTSVNIARIILIFINVKTERKALPDVWTLHRHPMLACPVMMVTH